jgi:hypothetical protein
MRTASKPRYLAGSVMSGLVIAFMLFDAGMKLVPLDIVIKSTAELGYPPSPDFARGSASWHWSAPRSMRSREQPCSARSS